MKSKHMRLGAMTTHGTAEGGEQALSHSTNPHGHSSSRISLPGGLEGDAVIYELR